MANLATDAAAGTANTCVCGVVMPSDPCVSLASNSVKTSCKTTSDGATPAKKCCLATFTTIPTTSSAKAVL